MTESRADKTIPKVAPRIAVQEPSGRLNAKTTPFKTNTVVAMDTPMMVSFPGHPDACMSTPIKTQKTTSLQLAKASELRKLFIAKKGKALMAEDVLPSTTKSTSCV